MQPVSEASSPWLLITEMKEVSSCPLLWHSAKASLELHRPEFMRRMRSICGDGPDPL